MQEIRGQLHDGVSSQSREAVLRVYPEGTVRLTVGDEREETLDLQRVRIPPRLGSTPRKLVLPGGREFETANNDTVDAIADQHRAAHHGWLHWLENRLGVVTVAAVFVLAAGGLFIVYGVPALAREAAFAVSPEMNARVGQGTLELLDQAFSETELSEARQVELQSHFARVIASATADHEYTLVFRGGGAIGANAFALPSGTVVLTDELTELAERDEEIIAVLAHEVGHVVHRHGLRQTIQSSMLAISLLLLTGDLSSASAFVAALPTALAESRFSREFEREADDYAIEYLLAQGISPTHFAQMLSRLETRVGEGFDLSFLASHPSTAERLDRLRRAAAAANVP
jgi:Zn-dependent protease with chaperone function